MGYSARRGFTSGSMRSTGAQRQAEMQQKIQEMQAKMTAAQDEVEAREFTAIHAFLLGLRTGRGLPRE